MKINKPVFLFIMLIFSAVCASAAGSSENKPRTVQISGQVRLVGSGPKNDLVITGEEREWYIDSKDREKLHQLQQQYVTVIGTEYFRDLNFANGSLAGRIYYLKNIKIIAPKK